MEINVYLSPIQTTKLLITTVCVISIISKFTIKKKNESYILDHDSATQMETILREAAIKNLYLRLAKMDPAWRCL